jgi:pseudouridine-5'-phosphate glycosidase
MNLQKYLNVQPEVQAALSIGKPVVALESTIIAHGMPYPKNVQTALEVEEIIRSNGATPATIAILDGKICVGLNSTQLEDLGKKEGVWKVSIRDIAYVISKKIPGATTVAATMRIAHWAGIKVFVTGGIGGVHREGNSTMDISADLEEMAETPVAIVSAGVKSILDIGLTLEYMETKGIPVITYASGEFPSFYSRQSGFDSPLCLDSAEAIAALIRVNNELGIRQSCLIANPIPLSMEIPFHKMETFISDALDLAKSKNIVGKNVTPFLLKSISEKTGGDSLHANIELVKNNAKLGAQIAVLI